MGSSGAPVALTLTSLGLISALIYIEPPIYQDGKRASDLTTRLYSAVAGENRIQERDEKRKTLDNFGFKEFVFDEAEPLKFSATKAGDGINFYMGSGNFDRYVGTIPLNQVEDYLKAIESKKGKK